MQLPHPALPTDTIRRARKNIITAVLAMASILSGHAALGHEASWPAKPVKLIAAVPAGSAPDVIARILANELSAQWAQPVVVENRPGAGGMIGMDAARTSAPDGYTLIMPHASAAVVTPVTFLNAKYDIERDFALISTVAYTPIAMVANVDSPARTLTEVIEASRQNPDTVNMGNPGHTTSAHLAAELLNQQAGAKLFHVPFSGNGVQATVGGDVGYYVDGVAPLLPMVRAKRVRPIAVFADRKLEGLEDFPLASDAHPGLTVTGWFVVAAPAGTPDAIVTKVNADVNRILAMSDIAARFREFGTYPQPGTVAETKAFVRAEKSRYAEILQKAGVKPQ